MKRKILIGMIGLLLLCGCTVSKNDLTTKMNTLLDDAAVAMISSEVNMNKGLMSYYLQPSIGRRESNATNSVFLISGNEVVLNIDVASIISQKYYGDQATLRDVDTFSNRIFEKEGVFVSSSDVVRDYRYRLYELTDKQYGILLQTSNLLAVAVVPLGEVYTVSFEMMMLVRGCRIDEEAVASRYSQKELINYQKETLEIFEKIYPENGLLSEMGGND